MIRNSPGNLIVQRVPHRNSGLRALSDHLNHINIIYLVISVHPLNTTKLRRTVNVELESRRCNGDEFSFSETRDGRETLYGLTGAVNIKAALGLPPGDNMTRKQAADRILSWRNANGQFDNGEGPGHGLHMVLGALNLLGQPIPEDIGPLAPTDVDEITNWLHRHDWGTTHKELCGQTIPLLASGRVGVEWIEAFVRGVSSRLDPNRPREIWCDADAPAWRVISCIFHVLSAFDAGRIPYPRPKLIADRLLGLNWDDADDDVSRTICTDGDWALVLLQLCHQLPRYTDRVMSAIRRVSRRRVAKWHENQEDIMGLDTHHLYCYLWNTAVFQSCVRDHYAGGYLRDTLNDPALYQLKGPDDLG